MKNHVISELSKALLLLLAILLIVYMEHSRYELKANQFDLDESAVIHHKKNYLKSYPNVNEVCSLYSDKLGKRKQASISVNVFLFF